VSPIVWCLRQETTVHKSYVLLFVLLVWFAAPLAAQTKGTATFSGLKDLEFINNYYNGGTGSMGSGPGKNFQLQFTSNAQAIVSGAKHGSGNFINNPGGSPVMFFGTGTNIVVNAIAGISTGLWFSYSALQPGTVTIYDGPNATGSILANIALTLNNSGCNTYKMCVWSPVGVPLTTNAGSIRFSGVANYLGIGAIHLGVKIPSLVSLTSSHNPSVQGEAVTFTAAVSATGAAPVGTVTFKTGTKVLGAVPVTGGVAAITLSDLPVGSTTIRATFSGAGFATRSASVTQVVN
jgi:hypothetical protein